jgi:cyclic beta-1,2-glucan glucanotransferase
MVDPVIPPDWKQFSMSYRYGETLYEMNLENPDAVSRGVTWIELDGVRMSTPYFVLQDDKRKHTVRIRLGGQGKTTQPEEAMRGIDLPSLVNDSNRN